MHIAALQLCASTDLARNLDRADALIADAAGQGAELVALPEYFCLMGRHDRDKLALAEREGDGPIQARLAAAARRHGVWVAGGTLPLQPPGHDPAGGPPGRVRNTTLVFDPEGRQAARYDKVHLFRFDDGSRRHDEAATLEPGPAPVALTVRDRAGGRWRIGLAVCYDLRFPEHFRALMRPEPCDLLLVPAAFTVPTGRAHWELLLRARAVENQCYVLAPGQAGHHENGRATWGHSLAVDPWGERLGMLGGEGEGVLLARLDRGRLEEVRRQLPALDHRVL